MSPYLNIAYTDHGCFSLNFLILYHCGQVFGEEVPATARCWQKYVLYDYGIMFACMPCRYIIIILMLGSWEKKLLIKRVHNAFRQDETRGKPWPSKRLILMQLNYTSIEWLLSFCWSGCVKVSKVNCSTLRHVKWSLYVYTCSYCTINLCAWKLM